MKIRATGEQITGITIANVPNAHLQVECLWKLSAAAGPAKVFAMYGQVEKAKSHARFFKLDVSAMKTSKTYVIPLYPTQ